MNHTITHRTALDTGKIWAVGLERLPFSEGLFQLKAAAGSLESPDLECPISFDNLVGSFSANIAHGGEIEMSVKCRTEQGWSNWYVLGTQKSDGYYSPPETQDSQAILKVDELELKFPANAARYRLRFRSSGRGIVLRSITLTLSNQQSAKRATPSRVGAWTRELQVKPRSQMETQKKYKNDICSPTSVAMMLDFWGFGQKTENVAKAVQDKTSKLFGNWPANTSYAASYGLDARVERLNSLGDLESQIALGHPVIVSLTFGSGELPGSPIKKTAGHLVVVIGFTPDGDLIVNDPAAKTQNQVRRIYNRQAFHRAWCVNKRGLAYIISPDLPRGLTVGVPTADLWSKPAQRTGPIRHDPAHLTQLLYGEEVTVIEAKNDWVLVHAEEQTSDDTTQSIGYPGWMKAQELISATMNRPNCVIRVRQALVHHGQEILTLSVGTRLQRIAEKNGSSIVRLLDGTIGEMQSDTLFTPPEIPTAASRDAIIRTAELFLGTSYYWGGRSGVQADPKLGVDCSGLVSLAYRIHGRDLPRNSHGQKMRARPILSKELQIGDLVFLTENATMEQISHVMLYTGGDGLIESRKSSGRVLRTTFFERFGKAISSLESGDFVTDLSFSKPRRRRLFFGSYF